MMDIFCVDTVRVGDIMCVDLVYYEEVSAIGVDGGGMHGHAADHGSE